MSEKRFSKGDVVYVIYGETIFRCTVSRSSDKWFEVDQGGTGHPTKVVGEGYTIAYSRFPNKGGYDSLAEAKEVLVRILRGSLDRLRRSVTDTERLITQLERELS